MRRLWEMCIARIKKSSSCIERYGVIVFFWIVALSIIPFWPSGYFFLLDDPIFYSRMAWDMKNIFDFSFFPVSFLLRGLSVFCDFWIIQRAIYFFAIFLLGIGGYRLVSRESNIGAYFAGILAIFNPFVYARIIEGQVNVLLGIIMGIWAIGFLKQFFEDKKLSKYIAASIFFALAIMWTPHSVFLVGIPSGLICLFQLIKTKGEKVLVKWCILFFVLAFSLNAGWIFWSLFSAGYTERTVSAIDHNHYTTFATTSGISGVYQNVAMLQGFWKETVDESIKNYQSNRRWKYPLYLLASLVLLGIITRFTKSRKSSWGFDVAILFSSIIAYILAIGVSGGPIISNISYFLYEHLPFYSGMREPQKWVGILLVGYVYFGGLGVGWLLDKTTLQKHFRFLAAVLLIAFPAVIMPKMFHFFDNTLQPTDFPKAWYQTSTLLKTTSLSPKLSSFLKDCPYIQDNRTEKCYDILVLPWHQYIPFPFTRSAIINPMMSFFYEYRVLQADNIEAWKEMYSQSTKKESKLLESYIGPNGKFGDIHTISKSDFAQFTWDMRWLWIRIIILSDPGIWEHENEILKLWVQWNFLKPISQESSMATYEIL